MAEKNVLIQEQALEQRLTPLQVQYVRMLEMTGPEMEDVVRRTVDENPAIELAEPDAVASSETDYDGEEAFEETAEQMRMADYADPDDIPAYRLEAPGRDRAAETYRPEMSDRSESLIDVLTQQMRHCTDAGDELTIADYIIGNIDENGYLQRKPVDIADDIAMYGDLPDVSVEDVDRVWRMIRRFEPAGVAAVDLRDCLSLQLGRLDGSKPAVAHASAIIDECFDMFSKRHFDAVRSTLHITRDELADALEVIRHLNPKPAAGFARSTNDDLGATVSPDFSVECDDDGNLTVTLLSRVPEMVLSRSFADAAHNRASARNDNVMTFVRRRRDEANSFIKAGEMRNNTMFRIMNAVASLQRRFFETGDQGDIKPMLLRDVAAVTGDDMSTVSRATSNKYVQTESGIFPLKIFFNERAVTANEDDDLSTRAILDKLRSLIDAEDKHKPLSDEALTAALNESGFSIARRTVTKYRERLRLPVARLRREL